MSLCVQNYDNAHVLPSFSCLFCSQQGWVAAQTAALLTAPGKLRRGAAVSAERLSGPRCRRGGCTRPWATLHTAMDDVAHGHGRRCTRPRATDNALFSNGKKARPHGFAPCTYGKRTVERGKRLMECNGKRTEDGSPRQTHIKNKRGLLISQVFIVPLPRIMPRVACLRRGLIPTQL